MPLPLAHSVIGYSVCAGSGLRFRRDTLTTVLFGAVIANLPDLDYLPGMLIDNPVLYHRTVAHTPVAGLLVALIVAALTTRFSGRFWPMFALATVVYWSHLLADAMHVGGGNGGVQLLWPFSDAWILIPTPLSDLPNTPFEFERGKGSEGLLGSFFTGGFLRSATLEALLYLPLVPLAMLIRARRGRKAGQPAVVAAGGERRARRSWI